MPLKVLLTSVLSVNLPSCVYIFAIEFLPNCPVSSSGSVWEGECLLLWQAGWRPACQHRPTSFWATTSSIPDGFAAPHGTPFSCRVLREQCTVPPHSSTGQPPPDQCSGGAGGISWHLGPTIQSGWWTGLSLLQGPGNCGGGQNSWAPGRGGGERGSDMVLGDPSAWGLLVWSRTIPRPGSVGMNKTNLQFLICPPGIFWISRTWSLNQDLKKKIVDDPTLSHFWGYLTDMMTSPECCVNSGGVISLWMDLALS